MRPAADVVDPFPRPNRLRVSAQHLDCLFSGLDSVEAGLPQPSRRRTQKMHVVVDQPWNDGSTAQVDSAGVRSREPRHLLICADSHNAIVMNSYRLRDRKAVVDGDNFPVRKDEIGCGRLRTQDRSGGQGSQDKPQRHHLVTRC
jgi:hypothetical protein